LSKLTRIFDAGEITKQSGTAMIHSSHRDRKTKAIAEMLAMIADSHDEPAPRQRELSGEPNEGLWRSATEFGAALNLYCAAHALQMKRKKH
jgi:hypothetical protein